MDRMPKFDNEPVSLEIQPVEDMLREEPEIIAPVVERETPFLPPKKERKQEKVVKEKKPISEKQKAHLERMRERRLELQQAKLGKFKNKGGLDKTPDPEPEPPAPEPRKPEIMKQEKKKPPPKKTEKDDFETFLQHYELLEKLKNEVKREDEAKRLAEETRRNAELKKEQELEAKIRKKILAEQQRTTAPRRWTPSVKQSIPATQNHLSTPNNDFGIYSNRYF